MILVFRDNIRGRPGTGVWGQRPKNGRIWGQPPNGGRFGMRGIGVRAQTSAFPKKNRVSGARLNFLAFAPLARPPVSSFEYFCALCTRICQNMSPLKNQESQKAAEKVQFPRENLRCRNQATGILFVRATPARETNFAYSFPLQKHNLICNS